MRQDEMGSKAKHTVVLERTDNFGLNRYIRSLIGRRKSNTDQTLFR